MNAKHYRLAEQSDVPAMARIRAAEWETEEYWRGRISRYLNFEDDPRQARRSRVSYVALESDSLVGFIAGHLTRRLACDGELQWIDVIPERRGTGVALELLRRLAMWFTDQKATRVCIDVQRGNTVARRFYMRHGAVELNAHWLVWDDIRVVAGPQP